MLNCKSDYSILTLSALIHFKAPPDQTLIRGSASHPELDS